MTDTMEVDRLCGAKTRGGDPCRRVLAAGATRCRMHGGSSPQARQKAQERVLRSQLNGQLQEMGWEPVQNPVAVLADVLGEMVAFKDLAREQMSLLNRWEAQGVLGNESVSARVVIYAQALRDVATTADKLWARGLTAESLRQHLEAEKEQPTREQAETLTRVIDGLLRNLDLPPEIRARVPEALHASLQAEGLI